MSQYPIQNSDPRSQFPKPLADLIDYVEKKTQAPIALIIGTLLGMLAIAFQHLLRVERPNGQRSPVSLNIMTIAASGERKTTVFNMLRKAIDIFCEQERLRINRLRSIYADEVDDWNFEKLELRRQLRKIGGDEEKKLMIQERLSLLNQEKPVMPKGFKLVTQDATPQSLIRILDENLPTTGIVSSEGGTLLESPLFQNLPLLNSLFGAEPIEVDRVTQDPVQIQEPLVSTVTAIQQEVLQTFMQKNEKIFHHSGFSARYLIAESPSNRGYRNVTDDSPAAPLDAYQARLTEALNSVKVDEDAGELPEPYLMRYTTSSSSVSIRYAQDVEWELRPGGFFADVPAAAAKSSEMAARISAILQFYEHRYSEINVANAERGVALAKLYLEEQKRLFGANHEIQQLERDAAALDAWFHQRCQLPLGGAPTIPQNEILQSGPNRLRNRHRRNAALTLLVSWGRVRHLKRNKTDHVWLNPVFYRVRNDPTSPPFGGPTGLI